MNRTGRLDSIDFWRGCVLCMIFVDHMPGNVLENATPRNFGFSDAAEAFVFLSGLSIALAYGGRFGVGERLRTLRGLGGRALKLYGAHIGLSLAALGIFFAGAAWAAKPELLAVHGRDLFVDDPGLGLFGLFSLGHQLGYFNILPLYMALILSVPALLLLAAIDWRLMLTVSACLYGAVRLYHWNLPNWPGAGGWFFDPFAWQFLFAIGVAAGLNLRSGPIPVVRPVVAVAAIIVAASVVVVTHGFGLSYDALELLRSKLDIDKSQLGLVRLVHFLALVYLIYGLRMSPLMRRLPLYEPLSVLGRHSLWVFVLMSLSSAVWQVMVEAINPAIWFDAGFSIVSLGIIFVAAQAMDAAGRRAATAEARAPYRREQARAAEDHALAA